VTLVFERSAIRSGPRRQRVVASPIGELHLTGTEHVERVHLRLPTEAHAGSAHDDSAFADAVEQLGTYFAGELQDFDLCVAPAGTPFQLQVWAALAKVPYGSTCSYQDLACRVGSARAARAVGQAVARNPLLILVPCHRVLSADGRLGGFAAGPERKQALLELEGAR